VAVEPGDRELSDVPPHVPQRHHDIIPNV
jgi:hypothetical protein